MAKLHWTPWLALAELGRETERLVEETAAASDGSYAWIPVADAVETAEEFRVTLELPGVARGDVTVEARGQFLTIQGERRFAKEPGGGLYQVLERSYGPFSRRFALPKGVARADISAVMKDGLLVVTMPKIRPESLRRRICIS